MLTNSPNYAIAQVSNHFTRSIGLNKPPFIEFSNSFLLPQTDEFTKVLSLNTWLNPEVIHFSSINDAASKLKSRQRNWHYCPGISFRRGKLIEGALPKTSPRPLYFGQQPPESPLGHWCLLSENTLLCASACSGKTPEGHFKFVEDKKGPPSRAYLKLWEFFTKVGHVPRSDSLCIDLGASPGGWTWVLSSLAKEIISVDKAELAQEMETKKIRFLKEDILKLKWKAFLKDAAWLSCDAALSPERLIPIISEASAAYPNLSFVCTLKQKLDSIPSDILKALELPQSNLLALSHNKHELTWYKIAPGTSRPLI